VAVADGVLDEGARAAGGPSPLLSTEQRDAEEALRKHGVLVGPGPNFLTGPERVRLRFSDVTPEEAADAGQRIASLIRAGRLTIAQATGRQNSSDAIGAPVTGPV
jgi:DNA-binding transcriptional MocR family regulator